MFFLLSFLFLHLERKYNPFYYTLANYDFQSDQYALIALNPNQGTEYLSYQEGDKTIANTVYFEGALNYNKTIAERHEISGMLVGIIREEKYANNGNLQTSLPYRNLGLSGRFTYALDSKYFGEFNAILFTFHGFQTHF